MKINKEGIKDENKDLALSILNKLRAGSRVIGNPAEGLKITLKEMDKKLKEKKSDDPTSFEISDMKIITDIKKIKSGINGEETLAAYFEKIIKHNQKLDGLIVFASLSSVDLEDNPKDYIPDTDFVAVYGDHILILDAKNIITSPEIPIYIDQSVLKNPSKEIMELHPSNHIWERIFRKSGIHYSKIEGCCVIINKIGATIMKNQEWYTSPCKPIFIGDLNEFLEGWTEEKENTVSLKLLTEIAKTQIKKERSSIELSDARRRFSI